MFNILPTLSAWDVAHREGLSIKRVWYLLAADRIFPVTRLSRAWAISDPYVILPKPRGRPVGATGRYPKGVKRPKKTETSTGE